jgi:TonB family protein
MDRVKNITLIAATLLVAIGLSISEAQNNTSSQDVVSKNKVQNSREVDRLLEELKIKNENVAKSCLENCDSKQIADKVTGGGIVDKILPEYPPIARAAHASGNVVVLIMIDEDGKVIAAQSVSGHPLLQAAAVRAARDSTFMPYLVDGAPTKVIGTLTYSFVLE